MTQKDPTFSQALQRLEQIVEKLEDPNLDLEDGLALLEEGVKLHKYCQTKLTQANSKIMQILKDDEKPQERID
ncbi:exodeoxyribonuclease VII small subunit [Candidatus Woesebacteria bacterium]|nr:exodeoxyribonuclease VII small subunit [Candidatus Woesebacteria bacterium]